jgi:hypothetical protein
MSAEGWEEGEDLALTTFLRPHQKKHWGKKSEPMKSN